MNSRTLDALALLTHDPSIPYLDYVAKIKENPIVRAVKLADLRHNSNTTRLETVDAKTEQRIQKYQAAIALLENNQTPSVFANRRRLTCEIRNP